MRLNRQITICAVALTVLVTVGCKKSVIECEFYITPSIQTADKGAVTLSQGVIAYGFYADTLQWAVTSYRNALDGVISDRFNNDTRKYDFSSVQDNDGVMKLGPFKKKKLILLACDTVNKLYGWRSAVTAEDLPAIVMSIKFQTWKQMAKYEDAKWIMVNEFYVPAPNPTPEPAKIESLLLPLSR